MCNDRNCFRPKAVNLPRMLTSRLFQSCSIMHTFIFPYVSGSDLLQFQPCTFFVFMPPTSKKLMGHIGLGLSVVCGPWSVALCIGQERLEVGFGNLIFGICMKNKRNCIFFSFPSDLSLDNYGPFSMFFSTFPLKAYGTL